MSSKSMEESMDIEVLMTDSSNADFLTLVKSLDADLEERYGELQKQYEKHNKVDAINNVVVVYEENVPVACGAFKQYDADTAELKRIFVLKEHRNQGLAKLIINKLEDAARNSGYRYLVLETGVKQIEAVHLYKSIGYEATDNYGSYVGNLNSVCMRKAL